ETDTLFDRFAGFFHAFGCLERAVRSALSDGRDKEASYRLFGKKYDSLGSLLDRMAADAQSGDPVDRYVIILCAKQLCQEIARDHADSRPGLGSPGRQGQPEVVPAIRLPGVAGASPLRDACRGDVPPPVEPTRRLRPEPTVRRTSAAGGRGTAQEGGRWRVP